MDEQLSQVKELRKLYLSKVSTEQLFELLDKIIDDKNYGNDIQVLIHANTCDDDTAKEYPLPKAYDLKFLKELIRRIESSCNVVNESIYNNYIELLNDRSSDDFYHVTYIFCDREFTFKQSNKMISDGTTGLRSWEASFQLFEQIYANKDIFKNKRVLELGSGSGMAGILISSLCQIDSYTFTDHHEKVIELIKNNLEINGFNLDKNSEKRSNKFYQFEDEQGKKSIKYYNDEDNEGFGDSFKVGSGSFGGFGSNFVRSGPMDLENSRSAMKSDDFNFKFNNIISNEKSKDFEFSNDSNSLQGEDIFKVDLDEKFKKFDEKIENLKNEKMINFEEFLKSFEEKLSLLDENVNKITQTVAKQSNSTNKSKEVNVAELDWSCSNNEIIDLLNKYKPHYVIGSDIVYDPDLIPELLRVFKLCLSTLDCGLIIVCSIRNESTIKQFEQKLRELQKEEQISIQRNKLSAKLSYFENVKLGSTKFVLYNIRNDDNEDEE